MAFKDFINKFGGNPLEKSSVRELREEELRQTNTINRVKKEIEAKEKEKQQKLLAGKGADLLTKKMLSQEIMGLDLEAKNNLRLFQTAHKELQIVQNMRIIKGFQAQLTKRGVWKKFGSVAPEQWENFLIRSNLNGKAFNEVLDNILEYFGMETAEVDKTSSDDEKKIMDLWSQMEKGELTADGAAKEISVTRDMEGEKA